MMELSNQQKKKLKALGHSLNPVVTIGQQGMKASIHEEFDLAITTHQLIKVKIVAERDERAKLIEKLAKRNKALCVQSIGGKALFYRRNRDKDDLFKD